jgi:cyclophilin family peptidyl-prolyl cis-trans isomerase
VPTEKRQRQKEGRQRRLEAQRKVQRRRQIIRRSIIVVVIAAIVVFTVYKIEGPSTAKALTAQQKANQVAVMAGCPASPTTRVNTLQWSKAPAMTIHKNHSYDATIVTDLGVISVALDAATAPVTVNSFIFLADHRYYNCVTFHRVIPTFMDQTGDPTATGSGSPGYTVPDEYPPKSKNPADQYPIGSVALANTTQPHTGGAQFFIVTGPEGESLPNAYTIFGHVTSGLAVADKINADGKPNVPGVQNSGTPPAVIHRIFSVTITPIG